MKFKDAIMQMLSENNKSQGWLAEKLDYNRASGISNMLARGNATIDVLYAICEALDYELVVQPKRSRGARPSGQIVIEGNERKKRGS